MDLNSLRTKNLLLIVPHFRVFIRDQSLLIKSYLNDIKVLMPSPRFSYILFNLPYVNKYFQFLKFHVDSLHDSCCTIISPKFFTLPVEVVRKRNCYLAAKSCIKALSKVNISFDLMHAHFLENGFIGASLKEIYNKPFVLTAHGGDVYEKPFKDSWYNTLAKYILQEAEQVITVSWFNAKKLLSLGVSNNKLHVIPNGYDEKRFKPISMYIARKKLGLPFNKKILLSVGNLVSVKGHVYLIDAMRFISRERDDTILIIIGTGILRDVLEKRSKKYGLNDKIIFTGGRPHEEIPLWMNACDLFILPSLSEGFPTVIPEAMACGKPVIASNVGGIPEVVSSSDVGILVPPKDAEALSQAILEGLHRKWNMSTILNHAAKYSWSTLIKRILLIYQKVLESVYP
ncbi:MAG: glycosyltransferase family 4 protein [Thermofilaceae archaeon]